METTEDWSYVGHPAFIARFQLATLQIRRLDTDEWVDVSFDVDLWRTVEQDGSVISQEDAEKLHTMRKEKNSKKSV